jgi:hypothetical protein
MEEQNIVVILGSAPQALEATHWPRLPNLTIVAINNAWRVREDWDYLVHAGDFPVEGLPESHAAHQQIHTHTNYVAAQNRYGGFVYAGGTMAFTAGYWALDTLRPSLLAYFGCDMIYEGEQTHFYGKGSPDPLREDVTLRSLEAKSARLMIHAAYQNCACVNLSTSNQSRLVFPRAAFGRFSDFTPVTVNREYARAAEAAETALGYRVESGEYWHEMNRFDTGALDRIDQLWLRAIGHSSVFTLSE